MAQNTQLDSQALQPLYFPYNRILAELDDTPHLVAGLNSSVTLGGKLTKRPGTLPILNGDEPPVNTMGLPLRMDRCSIYETLESPPKMYLIASFYDSGDGLWKAYYNRPASSTGWVLMTNTRSLAESTAPHEIAVSRGLAYIKALPASGASDKYGTAIFDGTTIDVRFWGLPQPTVPAHINGEVTRFAAGVTDTDTAWTVVVDLGITVPFNVHIGTEEATVTAKAGVGDVDWTVTRAVNGTVASGYGQDQIILYFDGWDPSDHQVNVGTGWFYTYAWKSVTGQVSCRAPFETNYDLPPSDTGPFTDLIPEIVIQGHADTTNIPKINIYRSTDGGGTYYFLEEITNTGAGDIAYRDDSLGTGATSTDFEDPIPDVLLDTRDIAPSLVSNSPPPAVIAPEVTGIDAPEQYTPIASYAGRLWYGIGNILFYSAQEELNEGVPEESYPAGIAGNFFRIQYPIINVAATTNALYLFTLQCTFVVTGNNRETFNVRPLYTNLGAPFGNPRAVTQYGNKVAFLSHDFRVMMIEGDSDPIDISSPLFTDIIDQFNLSPNMECDIKYWGDLEKEWIVVAVHDKGKPSESRQWVFDIKLSQMHKTNFWYPPWSLHTTCLYSGRIAENQSQRRLGFWVMDDDFVNGFLVRMDPTGRTPTDQNVDELGDLETTGINFYFETHQHVVPSGNHVNQLRAPALSAPVQYIILNRTLIPGDRDPDIYYYINDFWSDPIAAAPAEDDARSPLPKGFKTLNIQVNEVCFYFAFRAQMVDSNQIIEFQNYAIVWDPDAGA